eukprot:7154463-Prymnesium_polylepis.1
MSGVAVSEGGWAPSCRPLPVIGFAFCLVLAFRGHGNSPYWQFSAEVPSGAQLGSPTERYKNIYHPLPERSARGA